MFNYKDTVGKNLINPETVTLTNNSEVLRSDGLVSNGYLANAKVFHDLNENGLFDVDQDEVSVQTFSDGSFKGLHEYCR